MRKRSCILLDLEGERTHQICRFMWNLIEETSRWDLVPNQRVCGGRAAVHTTSGCYQFLFEEKFKIFGCAMNRRTSSHDAIEERVHSANKGFWKDILINKSKDVPWKVKCQRLVDHVYAVFAFGSEKLVMDHTDSGADQRMGNQDDGAPVPRQKTQRRNMGRRS